MNWNGPTKPHKPQKSLEEFFQDFLNDPATFLKGLVVLLIITVAATSFYTVKPEEKAVVTRLGRYITTEPPGLHVKLPVNIDKVQRVKTSLVHEEAFGFYLPGTRTRSTSSRLLDPRRSSYSRDLNEESLMLTGDLNVADVQWVVQYQISEPRFYLFNVADPVKNIRDISQAAMRRVVGDRTVNDVLTTGRAQIETDARLITQQILDDYKMGVEILGVKLQDVNPPENVKASFNDVNAARQEQKQLTNTAEAEYNKVIPKAKGEKEQKIEQARGYAEAIVNRAKGDASHFTQVLAEYRKAPEITRTRLYLELVQDLIARSGSLTIVDPSIKGVLPIFADSQDNSTRASLGLGPKVERQLQPSLKREE
ncbi:FtsH protease activity modulator HflK [Oligoflexia bacterium]|nr:FtsH protease activity modulator HflK [Oligoflexia bacterium]